MQLPPSHTQVHGHQRYLPIFALETRVTPTSWIWHDVTSYVYVWNLRSVPMMQAIPLARLRRFLPSLWSTQSVGQLGSLRDSMGAIPLKVKYTMKPSNHRRDAPFRTTGKHRENQSEHNDVEGNKNPDHPPKRRARALSLVVLLLISRGMGKTNWSSVSVNFPYYKLTAQFLNINNRQYRTSRFRVKVTVGCDSINKQRIQSFASLVDQNWFLFALRSYILSNPKRIQKVFNLNDTNVSCFPSFFLVGGSVMNNNDTHKLAFHSHRFILRWFFFSFPFCLFPCALHTFVN